MIWGMVLALAIFGTAFAAACILLAVRIVNGRERWTTLAVVIAIGAAAWWLLWMGGKIPWLPKPPIWIE
jgi:hypothetical protein